QSFGIDGGHDAAGPGGGSLHQRQTVEIRSADHRRRVGEVEAIGPQTTVLPHRQRSGMGGLEGERVLDLVHQVDLLRAGPERVRGRRERPDYVVYLDGTTHT